MDNQWWKEQIPSRMMRMDMQASHQADMRRKVCEHPHHTHQAGTCARF